jgi:hypothetical protein
MNTKVQARGRRVAQVVFGLALLGLVVFVMVRMPRKPDFPRWDSEEKLSENAKVSHEARDQREADVRLVKMLLDEELSGRVFEFGVIAEAVSGKKVIPAARSESSARVIAAIGEVMDKLLEEMSGEDSPLRDLRRINEGSKFFEDGLMEGLNAKEGLECGVPETREGDIQRSGYPDLRILDVASGDVYYLDPKLMERCSVESSLRTFYFEPKDKTLKITEDATHLLVGIEHDGKDGEWTFLSYRIVDLSGLQVRLKAEFQASNRDLYSERTVLERGGKDGKDGER